MNNTHLTDINPVDFARTHQEGLNNLAEHGTPIEQVMAKAYLIVYGRFEA
jgi:hypothetical protein